MIEGVIVVDKTGRMVSVNPTVRKIFGVTEEEAKGRLFLEVIRNNDLAEVINSVLEKGIFISDEITLSLPVRGIFQVNAVPVSNAGMVSGCLVVIHDITEMRRLETVRSDFVANVSHELKTPLTSIKGFVETLLDGALDDKANSRDFLKIIQDHVGRLDSLVNDLLSLAHLESKEILLEKRGVDLRQLAEEVILGFSSQLRKKDINIKDELPIGLTVQADKVRLGQVFTNLIDNAIKFNNEKGSIKIYCQDTGDKVKIIVEDSGIGIPAKDISRIFERFYRVDKARSRELGGTGLGLSIVKHIVELHGGSVGVESVESLGSKFWLTIPK
jgi:two-component system phosphate regulon sensor histidine kinase PhoR